MLLVSVATALAEGPLKNPCQPDEDEEPPPEMECPVWNEETCEYEENEEGPPSGSDGEICISDTHSVNATGGDGDYSYVSDDEDVATVDDDGVVTPVGPGEAKITIVDGNACTGSVTVTVSGPVGTPATICVGSEHTIEVTGEGPFEFSPSSDVSSSGVVESTEPGEIEVTITDVNGCSNTVIITVTEVTASDVTVCVGGVTAVAGAGGSEPYTYGSLDESIVEVDQDTGVVTGKAVGTANIEITDVNGCSVQVLATVETPPYTDACGNAVCDEPDPDLTGCCGDGETYNPEIDECCDDELMSVEEGGCCPDYEGGTIGPITFDLTEPGGADEDQEENCTYSFSADATFSMPLAGLTTVSIPVSIEDTTVSFVTAFGGEGPTDITVSWTGSVDHDLADGKITAILTSVDLALETESSDLAGSAVMTFVANEDISLGSDYLMLKSGATGTLTLTYSDGVPSAAFSDLSLTVDMLKETDGSTRVLATFTADQSPSEPSLISGVFEAKQQDPITINGVSFTLNSFNSRGTVDMESMAIDIENGDFSATIEFLQEAASDNFITGVVDCSGDYDSADGFSGTATIPSGSPLAFAGAELFGTVSADFSPAFDFERVSGSGISLKHSGLGQQNLQVSSFLFTGDNGLESLDVAAASVVYKNKAEVQFNNASWSANTAMLTFESARVVFGTNNIALDVSNFRLNAIESTLNLEGFAGQANFPALTAAISGRITQNEFSASISAQFMAVNVTGSIALGIAGTEPDIFNYGLVELDGDFGPGIPMGQIPVKLKRLAGKAGYNEDLTGGVWTPTDGSYVLGAGVGFTDSANIVQLNGDVVIQLSQSSPKLTIGGALAFPASGATYVSGSVQSEYILGSSNITGTASTALSYPAGGTLINVDSGQVNFNVGLTAISIQGGGFTGRLLSLYEFTGGYQLSGDPTNPNSLAGNLGLSFADSGSFAFTYPSDFDPSTGDNTTWVGFGISANLTYQLGGHAMFALANGDFSGTATVTLSGSASGTVKWPLLLGGHLTTSTASLDCSGTISKAAGESALKLSGELNFAYNGYSGSASVADFPLN